MKEKPFIKPEPTLTHEDALLLRKKYDEENYDIYNSDTPVKVVFIGDSLTCNWNLMDYFSEDKGRVLNRGIGGDKSDLLLIRLDADCIQLQPKLAVLGVGINNTWSLDDTNDAGEIDKMLLKIKSDILRDLEAAASRCRENSIGVILASVLPVNILPPTPGSPTNSVRNKLIISINKEIKSLAEKLGVVYVDYHSELVSMAESGPCLKLGLASDGIHVGKTAYDTMAGRLKKTLCEKGIVI